MPSASERTLRNFLIPGRNPALPCPGPDAEDQGTHQQGGVWQVPCKSLYYQSAKQGPLSCQDFSFQSRFFPLTAVLRTELTGQLRPSGEEEI